MARNRVAANLLLAFILFAGFFSLASLPQEFVPEVSMDRVSVSVSYPGATPDEVEQSVLLKIEEQIEQVEGLKRTRATAVEGRALLVAEVDRGWNVRRFLGDVEARINGIQTFPVGAERPELAEVTNRQSVIRIVLYGDAPERTLKELAYRTEDGLSALPEVSYVETTGIRDYEISIEAPLPRLRALGLTLGDIASAVRAGSLDVGAGSIDTPDEEVRIRTTGLKYTRQDFEEIIVLAGTDGAVVRLGDIAEVRDGFRDAPIAGRYRGLPAAYVEVFRTADEKILEIVDAVEQHLEAEVRPSLPAGVRLDIWNNDGDTVRSRLGLLVENGLLGLVLVLISLALFLELRLAFWVAIGIGVSFVGTFAVMAISGSSINQLSLFGFILAVGIVVDDAIVVGENIFAERQRGAPAVAASIGGTRGVMRPVIFAVLTSVAAFCPLLFIPSALGRLFGEIPVIVIAVLLLSLLESLLILPHHLAPVRVASRSPGRVRLVAGRIHAGVAGALGRFVEGPLDRILRFATRRPGAVIATAVAAVIVTVAVIPAGIMKFDVLPSLEGDLVTASLEMPEGTPAHRTSGVVRTVEAAGHRAIERLSSRRGEDSGAILSGVNVTLGLPARQSGLGGAATDETNPRANVAAVEFKLVSADRRDISATELQDEWREELGSLPGVKSLTVSADVLSLGAPVHVELSHPDPRRLAAIADTLMARLRAIAGVVEVQADQNEGVREIQLDVLPEARTLGLTLDGLARQVRAAFFGQEVLRVQRDREDVRVYVRVPEADRNTIADLEGMLVRTPAGDAVPLPRVASVQFGRSPTTIRRKDGQRVLAVTADVVAGVVTGDEITRLLGASVLPELARRNPGLAYSFGGERQEQVESLGALGSGFALALLAIYALLAIPLGSYTKPVIVMAAIPFGIVGALWGHLILGLDLSFLSLFGIVGLSGVVVNDSLVMIDSINERRRRGMPGREAILAGAKARFRPIFLTSLTTFLGVAPLMFERSLQAQYLIPPAVSVGFGIVFGTAVLLIVVPALATVEHRMMT